MKKLLIALSLLVAGLTVLIGTGPVLAGSGSRLMYDTVTLVSAETGTVTGDAVDLSAPYSTFTVDVTTLATGTVTVRIDGNGSADGVFDTTGMGTAITCASLKCTQVYNSQPMLQLRAVITSAEGTNSTTVKATGVQW